MTFHAFGEMLFHFFRKKSRVAKLFVLSLVSTIHLVINTCKRPYGLNCKSVYDSSVSQVPAK